KTPDEALSLMYEIESASKLKHTALINNSNLGNETNPQVVKDSILYAERLSSLSGLPILFTSNMDKDINIYVKKAWEE
ncbi:MAG: cobalamin biosynthesis protein CobQ, partial [Oscillospiraceae bacterium]|nr:cobalamin biosynthesis protein CobQ [Oscillospiraceae bacterium]